MTAAPVPPDGENPLRVDVRPADDRYFVWVCPTHGIISEDELAEGVDWQNPNPDGDIYTDEFFCQREHGEGEDHRAESYDLAPAFAAGRAAATPDPPDEEFTEAAWGLIANAYGGNWGDAPDAWRGAAERWRDEYIAGANAHPRPAASPDERLREALRDANEYLVQIADYSPSEVADAIDSVRAQIKDALAATDSRGKPDGASVPDQTRRIVVYDARHGRGGLDVPVGCTVGEAALLAAEMFGVRVGPNDRPSFGLRGTGLHPSDPLPDDEDYDLFVIGGTV